MLATFIINQYSAVDTTALAEAVEELCSPKDDYGWSSSGIYSFWNTETKEMLYVGLAIDLPLRFQQHNGLSPCLENCCKRSQISEHFQTHGLLGYSIFVQSTLQQAISHRWENANAGKLEWIAENFGFFDPEDVKEDFNHDVINALRTTEGAMLAAHKKDHGRFPAWNKMGGAKRKFSNTELDTARHLLRSVTHAQPRYDPHIARSSLREMAKDSIKQRYEMYLHAVRMNMLSLSMPMERALEITHDGFGDLPQMLKDGYLHKAPGA